jgi:UDP-N-acetylmuramate dehydrogenase
MEIRENVMLAPMTTLQVGGPARTFVEARSEEDVLQAVLHARGTNQRVLVLGGGSNLLVADEGWPGMVVKIAIRGVETREEAGRRIYRVGAGEEWDGFVARTVEEGCAGVEALSGIPGTVGGTPVQNVGAYGQEVAETITSVRVVDTQSLRMRELRREECGFGYRRSLFNSSERERYVVTRVSFALTPGGGPRIAYADLQKYFAGRDGAPTLAETRAAVREIRQSKAMLIVPGDADARSAGSFFKNPVLTVEEADEVAARARDKGTATEPPRYPAGEGRVKLSAAWLVEQAGFGKGYGQGRVGLSRKHALAIVNRGGATAAEIAAFSDEVRDGVRRAWGIELEREPVLAGF